MSEPPKKKPRIYTRRGDLGETSLFSGPRVGKDQKRIVVCGTLDELSSLLGLARAEELLPENAQKILEIQKKLVELSTQIAAMTPTRHEVKTVQRSDVAALEAQIDAISANLPPLKNFILPGANKTSALLHVARTVCRRAERRLVALVRQDETVSKIPIAWLNRLGDLLFVLARTEEECRQG